jgi:monofunctional biosynthetic peptidoglycan transglycosylase
MDFETKADSWVEVRLPIDQFVAHSFGRKMPGMKLSPNQVHSVGILLGDKKPGPFTILIDSISVL